MSGSRKIREAVGWKLDRLRSGEKPRVLDLFAGCGGISLGAQLAGCQAIGAVELDAQAAQSHAHNFHRDDAQARREWHGQARDISVTDPQEFVRQFDPDVSSAFRAVDILVGGPPCQAFARVGRAKLREIMEHPEAFLHDSRSGLYRDHIRFVEGLAPLVVVIENVPDILNYGGLNIFETISGALEDIGYECGYGLLNASHYGVPQMRTRCFLIGITRLAETLPLMPRPTHHQRLPRGYRGSKDVAFCHSRLQARSGHARTECDGGRKWQRVA